jgi:hypothetical protein
VPLLLKDIGDAVLDKGGVDKDAKDDDLLLIGGIGVIEPGTIGSISEVLNIPFVDGTELTLELVI